MLELSISSNEAAPARGNMASSPSRENDWPVLDAAKLCRQRAAAGSAWRVEG
jgi:hypothetical protein